MRADCPAWTRHAEKMLERPAVIAALECINQTVLFTLIFALLPCEEFYFSIQYLFYSSSSLSLNSCLIALISRFNSASSSASVGK